jgi:glutamine synthetase
MAMQGAEDVVRRVQEDGIEQVRVVFLDYNGIARARSLMPGSLPGAFRRGVNFSSPTVDFNSRDLFPLGAAFDLASPDFFARPDPSTYIQVPYQSGVAQMYADLVDAGGNPWPGCPRAALRRLVERAAAHGLRFNVAFEPEGYLFLPAPERSGVEFVGAPQFATLAGLDVQSAFMHDLLSGLQAAGLEVEQWSEEYGPGQIEVNLRYTDPLAAADGVTTYKELFRGLARQRGFLGTFMPKPFGDVAGSGMHVHLSASPAVGDGNLFDEPGAQLDLSPLGRHALAGLLTHGAALTALGATTVNSYKRFLPGSWAPTHIVASYASRAAFVRIPERETPRRLELRVGDGAGNPSIYLAGILAAMLDGIEREIEPSPIVAGDVGSLSEEAAAAAGAHPVPRTLERALEALAADDVIRDGVGSLIVDELVKVKRSEWDAFAGHVGAWDREWYLSRY